MGVISNLTSFISIIVYPEDRIRAQTSGYILIRVAMNLGLTIKELVEPL